MSAASGLAAAKNRRCKEGPIVKVPGKPTSCAPGTSCGRSAGAQRASTPQTGPRGRSVPPSASASASAPAAPQPPQQLASAKDIAELLAGRHARELANGMKVPQGPLSPMQIMQLHELRLTQLESDVTQIIHVIAEASEEQQSLDSAAAKPSVFTPPTFSAPCAPEACVPASCAPTTAATEDIDELHTRCDELAEEVESLRRQLQDSKADFFKVQTFAMEAHMQVTKLAADLLKVQQQVAPVQQTSPRTVSPVALETTTSTIKNGTMTLDISDVLPTFTLDAATC